MNQLRKNRKLEKNLMDLEFHIVKPHIKQNQNSIQYRYGGLRA